MQLVDEKYLDEMLATLYQAKVNNPSPVILSTFVATAIENYPDIAHKERYIRMLVEKLAIDGYANIDNDRGGITITDEGIKFILNNEGYSHLEEKRFQESKVRVETIKALKRGKWALVISFFALLVSVAVLLFSILKK